MNTFDRRPLTRRTVLRAAGTLAGAGALTVAANDLSGNASGAPTAAFAHGVASGDPLADAVLIWTRITPFADATPGSGRGGPASLRWDVALDESFRQMVRSATVTTTAARDHTVTVDVTGLSPATRYFYRFTSLDGPTAGQVSPVGRTKTAPAPGAGVPALNFAFVSCANYEAGFFTAYRRLADHDEIDAVVALGDYIYEYPHNGYVGPKGAVRTVAPLHNVVRLAD
ncbi:alkaline phosphatase D family protein, partial [Gordonia sp. NPDC003429]